MAILAHDNGQVAGESVGVLECPDDGVVGRVVIKIWDVRLGDACRGRGGWWMWVGVGVHT